MAVRFINNFSAALAAGIASDATELSFAAGVGDVFRSKLGSPLSTDHIYLTIYNSGGDVEYVRVTATLADDFTVVRGQDNSTARAWLSGDMVACRPNAGALQEAVALPTNLATSGINLNITELRGLTTPLSVAQGGTGVTTGLTALPAGATGVTPAPGDNSTKLATTAFVQTAVVTATPAVIETEMNATGAAPMYACRAWVNFNGTRNVTNTGASTNGQPVHIQASGNVTSVTKNAVGDYTVNFMTAMPDANYSVTGTADVPSTGVCHALGAVTLGASSVSVRTWGSYGATVTRDCAIGSVAIFR